MESGVASIDLNSFNLYGDVICVDETINEVILDYSLESVFRLIDYPEPVTRCFKNLAAKNVRLMTSDYSMEFVSKSVKKYPSVFSHINQIEIYPYSHLERVFRKSEMKQSFLNYEAKEEFHFHFAFLNRAASWPRYQIMKKMLNDEGLMAKGAVSWLNRFNIERLDLGMTLVLDSSSADKVQHKYPRQYEESFLDVFCETNSCDGDLSPTMMTEKSWRPLMCGKAFLVYGAPGFYAYLKSLGFDVFDDILNLDFDKNEKSETRLDLFYKSLKAFVESHNLSELSKLNDSLKKRYERNRRRCFELNEEKNNSTLLKLN